MNTQYLYTGVFFDPDTLEKALRPIRRQRLEKAVPFPHVTFVFKPDEVDTNLFGKPVEAIVSGYGNDGKNEGIRVALSARDKELRKMIGAIETPHITLSLNEGAAAVDTRHLSFEQTASIRISGRFGGYSAEDGLVLEPARPDTDTPREKKQGKEMPMRNTTFLFFPFRIDAPDAFERMCRGAEASEYWRAEKDKNRYMFKYITDKLSKSGSDRVCAHYSLNDPGRGYFGITKDDRFSVRTDFHSTVYDFRFASVQCYCFSTRVGIMALQLVLDDSDPFQVANALFELKSVSKAKIRAAEDSQPFSLLSLAERIAASISPGIEFFYFANTGEERANFMTLVEAPFQDSFALELRYLRNGYSQGYRFDGLPTIEEELLKLQKGITWGISAEALACISCPDSDDGFTRWVFFRNFQRYYLFMYVFLLHQRYTLYMLLTRIGRGEYNDSETLVQYQQELSAFEANFVFSHVTEVPQYQLLYDRVQQAFSIREIFADVREPLEKLTEVRGREEEKRSKTVNAALVVISVLAVFSAWEDSFSFIRSLLERLHFGAQTIWIVQVVVLAVITVLVLGAVAYVIFAWARTLRKRR